MGNVVSLLDRPVYLYREVDRVLGLSNGTTRRWVNGYSRQGRDYPPILRVKPSDTEWTTWGEFVEVRILAEYRDQKIPTKRLRAAVEELRSVFDLRYPLAHARPYLEAERGDLAVRGEGLADMDDEHLLIVRTGEMLLTGRGRLVFDEATKDGLGDDDLVVTEIIPDPKYPDIVVNPERRGGLPTLRGRSILAATVAGMVNAGDPLSDVASDYGLTEAQVQQAIDYCAIYRIAA
ncbi:DUF433 domain-containing protein [Amycolatopsis granulosa]|uniref:DUF433 domain-containing protein n=1 Tax=Amycolatopsis granulosa TaxID=185684 RepID=UPI0014238574|nr:uncharacterized protein (DUF433 family)/transposase [Amycolatopsis granulosa]